MWKRPACGPLLTCSFHKCLLFFISRNKKSTGCVCVRVYDQRTCSAHTNRHANTVWEWGGWGFRASVCTYLYGNLPPHPHYSLPVWGGQVTEIHWFGSFHLFALFIDFHCSSSCRSLPRLRRHFHCVSSHFASRRTQAQLHAYLLVALIRVQVVLFFSPPPHFFFCFFMVDLLVVINLCNNSGSSHFVTQFESMAWMRDNLIFVKKSEKCKNMYV